MKMKSINSIPWNIAKVPGACLKIKMSSYQYMNFHYKYKMVSQLPWLNDENPCTWKYGIYIDTGHWLCSNMPTPSPPWQTNHAFRTLPHHMISMLFEWLIDVMAGGLINTKPLVIKATSQKPLENYLFDMCHWNMQGLFHVEYDASPTLYIMTFLS